MTNGVLAKFAISQLATVTWLTHRGRVDRFKIAACVCDELTTGYVTS